MPVKGWLKAIRNSMGMRMSQLAKRLGVAKEQISKYEINEASGVISIKTLRKVAKGLGCKFVYGFVPEKELEKMVIEQAYKVAKKRVEKAHHNMSLEKQEVAENEKEQMLDEMAQEILRKLPSYLWED